MPELIPYNRGMDRGRRQHYLKALGIDAWRLRASAPAEDVVVEDAVALAEPASPAVESPRATPRPARTPTPAPRPASVPQGDVPAAVLPEPPPIELPADWDGLRAMVRDCERCKLCATRTQTVFGVGQTSAPLMVVGEGPGADEDARGEPFVGRAGKLLDEMLAAIGRSRANEEAAKAVFIANVVKCRPPGNRDPQQDEVEASSVSGPADRTGEAEADRGAGAYRRAAFAEYRCAAVTSAWSVAHLRADQYAAADYLSPGLLVAQPA